MRSWERLEFREQVLGPPVRGQERQVHRVRQVQLVPQAQPVHG